jgi:hypothetical protein
MDSLRPPPHFDGMGFPRWKILMQSHLQANSLNIWRVTSDRVKSNSQQERQYDAIKNCAILSSLGDTVFNCVFACKNAKDLWKTISENHEGTKDVANEKYYVLIDKLNSFKQLEDENAETMYSRLNIFVNEINSLDVKKIDDLELIRSFIHSEGRSMIWLSQFFMRKKSTY